MLNNKVIEEDKSFMYKQVWLEKIYFEVCVSQTNMGVFYEQFQPNT